MSQALQQTNSQLPKDAATGLTLPLSKSLASSALAKHQALVAFEMEVLAKKTDRFGWERDRGTPAHDRLLNDWIDALQDYPLDEIQAACRAAILDKPKGMPNEGDIVAKIFEARRVKVAAFKAALPKPQDPPRPAASDEERARVASHAASFIGKALAMPRAGIDGGDA